MNNEIRIKKTPEDCIFYHTIYIPDFGLCEGSWDCRDAVDSYLGGVNFTGKKVLDVGPANGFFSFEMEKRGAQVVAIDLGQETGWDIVPNAKTFGDASRRGRQNAVRLVEDAFWFAHKRFKSKVQMIYGSAYETPNLIDKVDIALMGNVLQHLRDPFRAIEQVANVVDETIIITETLWDESDGFVDSVGMSFIPRADVQEVDHSWWKVSPPLVMEILRLLGFGDITCGYHKQKFNGSSTDHRPRMVKHFTITGTRLNHTFLEGWHAEENEGNTFWRWSSSRDARILLSVPREGGGRGNLSFQLMSLKPSDIRIRLNGLEIWDGTIKNNIQTVSLREIRFQEGDNLLQFLCEDEPIQASKSDDRFVGFAVYNFCKEMI